MALYRIDTAYFEAVNLQDTDVTASAPTGADGDGSDADDSRPNRWIARSAAGLVGPDATVIRIRALTGSEVDGGPRPDDPAFLRYVVEAGVHADDRKLLASLPWQFQRTLGGLVFEVSTTPLDRKK